MENLSLEDPPYWGDYSSLYPSLSVNEIKSLEKAILARRLGRLREAQRIFEAELPAPHILPVLAMERADLFSRLGLEGSRFSLLNKALKSRTEWRQRFSESEVKLLGIHSSEARLLSSGAARIALKEARSMRDEWTDHVIERWTDIEFGCALAYYSILKTCRIQSNWVDMNTDLWFSLPSPRNPGISLESIVDTLMNRRKWHLSIAFIRNQAEFVEDDAKLELCSKLLQKCQAQTQGNNGVTSLAILNAHLFLADTMRIDLEMINKSKEPLQNARRQLELLQWIEPSDQQRTMLQWLLLEDCPLQKTDPVAESMKLAASVRNSGDRLMESRILARVRRRMNQVDDGGRDENWQNITDQALKRYRELNSDPNGRIILIASLLSNIALTTSSTTDHTSLKAYLHKFADFEARYPDFDMPEMQQYLYRGAAVALRALGQKEEAMAAEAKQMMALRNSPPDQTQFYRKYRDKPTAEWAPHLIQFIMDWIVMEEKAGRHSTTKPLRLLFIQNQNQTTMEENADMDPELAQSPGILVELLYGKTIPVDSETWQRALCCFESWLWYSPAYIKRYIRHTILGDLQRARCATITRYTLCVRQTIAQCLDEDLQLKVMLMKKRENERLLELIKRLDPEAMGASKHDILSSEWSCVLDKVGLSDAVKAFRTGLIKDSDIEEAQRFFEEFYLKTKEKNLVDRLVTLMQIGFCKGRRYKLFGTVPSDAPLDSFAEYDRVYMEQRMAKSVLHGAENLAARAELVERWSFANHYDFAMGYCIEAIGAGQIRNSYHRHIHQDINYRPPPTPVPSRDMTALFSELIAWAQKKKARSVTEALGAEVIIPSAMLAKANLDECAVELLRLEADCQRKMDENLEDMVELHHEANTIRKKMRTHPTLAEITNLRDGQAMNRDQIKLLGQSLGKNVLIVDYVCVRTAFTAIPYDIIPMVYKDGNLVSAQIVTKKLNLETVKRWIDTYLDVQKPLLAARSALQGLYPLVEAAVKFSDPGDHILLCPSDILFRIPLHAIELPDGQHLIQRNPVIYTQSLSIFRICQTFAANLDEKCAPTVLAAQALSDKDMARPEAADMAFASRINARLLQGEALQKQTFLQACTEAELVHFYGHISYDQPKAMDQYLAIRDLESERVTVRDLFELRLRTGTHVNLIGCQSGRSQLGINDDLVGLSTALTFAGASSIVVALWSIQMDDAAAFQEAFYDDVIAQSKAACGQPGGAAADDNSSEKLPKYLDMAIAVQKAVLKIMIDESGETKAPYHWAGFFIQGCWNMFPTLKGL